MDTREATDLDRIDKDDLVDARGVRFKELRKKLTPRWGVLWAQLLAGHAALGLTVSGLFAARSLPLPALAVVVPIGAFLVGYLMAYIQLFLHEAAHYNIAKGRRLNDALANLLIGVLVGQDIKAYRPIHFDHHRFLGTPEDTERTYFDPLNARFILESLTGAKILKVLLGREKAAKEGASVKKSLLNAQLLFGLALHAALLAGACWLHAWALVAAWLLGMGVVFPFFAAVRQVLEHRDVNARPETDFRVVPHGAYNRMFGSGIIASTLGGAGFNRHMLHHWEPQISYTRFAALEAYLLETSAAVAVREHTTTYGATFRALMRAGSAS